MAFLHVNTGVVRSGTSLHPSQQKKYYNSCDCGDNIPFAAELHHGPVKLFQ